MLAEIVCGWSSARLAFQFFGYRIAHEIGEPDASPIKACPQVGLELRWQPDGDRHVPSLDRIT